MAWAPNNTWRGRVACRDYGWRTARILDFAALPDHNFLTAGDGTHTIAGLGMDLEGSTYASAFDIEQGTGLVWTRGSTGFTRLSIPIHDMWALDSDDRWRAIVHFAASQTLAGGDQAQVVAGAAEGSPSGTALALSATWLNSSGQKMRTNQFWSTWATPVDTAISVGASPVLELDVWRTHAVVRWGTSAPAADPVPPATLGRIVEVGHRLASANTAAEWGSNERWLQLAFQATAGSTIGVRRVTVQRLLAP